MGEGRGVGGRMGDVSGATGAWGAKQEAGAAPIMAWGAGRQGRRLPPASASACSSTTQKPVTDSKACRVEGYEQGGVDGAERCRAVASWAVPR